MSLIGKLETNKVLILGFGREGQSTYRFLRKLFPHKRLAIADKKKLKELDVKASEIIGSDNNLDIYLGNDYLNKLDLHEIVIKSPGIPYKFDGIRKGKDKGVGFTSQTKIFFELCKGKIIGITGTKGKSTTTSLIYHILRTAKVHPVLLGNIGNPPLDYLEEGDENTLFVFEMSSHQLTDAEKSPHIAIFLNVYPEHLDYYSSYNEYIKTKANITKFQSTADFFIYNKDFPEIEKISKLSEAKKYPFSSRRKVESGCYIDKRKIYFVVKGQIEFSFDVRKIPLLGIHNMDNVMAAIIASKVAGVDFEKLNKAVRSFKPLEGRLETVGVYNSVDFVNDTLATIPEATIAALESFSDRKLTLILGGFDRGISFDNLGRDLAKRKNVLNVILIGQTAPRIKKSLKKFKYSGEVYDLGSPKMLEVVRLASKIAVPSSVVLLSPASTSFDMFKDYEDRGRQFEDAVKFLRM